MEEVMKHLHAPFEPREIEWRVLMTGVGRSPYAMIAPYVDARAVTRRLDEIFGFSWQTDMKVVGEAVVCTLSVFVDGAWISRTDGANFTKVEPVKGGMSDALKRAAALFGVGKYLYYVPTPIFADLSTTKGQNAVVIEGTKYWWKPPEIDLYAEAMKEYDAIISGEKPGAGREAPAKDSPTTDEERARVNEVPVMAADYFKAMQFSVRDAVMFCRECDWDNNKIIKKVDELSSSY